MEDINGTLSLRGKVPGLNLECRVRSLRSLHRRQSTVWHSVCRSACCLILLSTWVHTRNTGLTAAAVWWINYRKEIIRNQKLSPSFLHSTLEEVTDVLVPLWYQMERFSDDLLLCVFSLGWEMKRLEHLNIIHRHLIEWTCSTLDFGSGSGTTCRPCAVSLSHEKRFPHRRRALPESLHAVHSCGTSVLRALKALEVCAVWDRKVQANYCRKSLIMLYSSHSKHYLKAAVNHSF